MHSADSCYSDHLVFKENSLEGGEARSEQKEDESSKNRNERTSLLCAACRLLITSHQARCEMCGSHEHTFANPHGILFHIGCFRIAPGCRPEGDSVTHFTWFPGYAWQISECSGCASHLGWSFESKSGHSFYGLVLDRLVEDLSDFD